MADELRHQGSQDEPEQRFSRRGSHGQTEQRPDGQQDRASHTGGDARKGKQLEFFTKGAPDQEVTGHCRHPHEGKGITDQSVAGTQEVIPSDDGDPEKSQSQGAPKP